MGLKIPRSFVYRVRCNSRSCTNCVGHVIDLKLAVLPVDVPLYAREIAKCEWAHLADQLRYQRKQGNPGNYSCVPVNDTRLVIFSDAVIGEEVTLEMVEEIMHHAPPECGRISSSREWKVNREPIQHSEGFVDCGPVRASLEEIEAAAAEMGLVGHEDATSLWYETTPEQHEQLLKISGVIWEERESLLPPLLPLREPLLPSLNRKQRRAQARAR